MRGCLGLGFSVLRRWLPELPAFSWEIPKLLRVCLLSLYLPMSRRWPGILIKTSSFVTVGNAWAFLKRRFLNKGRSSSIWGLQQGKQLLAGTPWQRATEKSPSSAVLVGLLKPNLRAEAEFQLNLKFSPRSKWVTRRQELGPAFSSQAMLLLATWWSMSAHIYAWPQNLTCYLWSWLTSRAIALAQSLKRGDRAGDIRGPAAAEVERQSLGLRYVSISSPAHFLCWGYEHSAGCITKANVKWKLIARWLENSLFGFPKKIIGWVDMLFY